MQASKSFLPVESNRAYLIPEASCDMYEMVARRKAKEIQCLDFLVKAGHIGIFCLANTKTPDPIKKGGGEEKNNTIGI